MTQKNTNAMIAERWAQLRHAPTRANLWHALAQAYARMDLPWQTAYAARQAARLDPALATPLPAPGAGLLPATSGSDDALLGRESLPQAALLAERFHAQTGACPGDWLSWLYLARLQDMPEVGGEGLPAAGQALAMAQSLEPIAGESLHWLGVWRLNAGNAAGAVAAFSGLLDIRPIRCGSMMYLGEALLQVGNTLAAEKAFARAAHSSNPQFLQNLAARLYTHNYWQEAITTLEKAIALQPAQIKPLLALAKIQSEVYLLDDCRHSLDRIKVLAPDDTEAGLLEAGLRGRLGDARGHFAMLQAAYAAGGDPLSRLASSIAMTALYQDDLPPDEIARLHRRLSAPIEAAVRPHTEFANPRTTARRLRIGYVTGDLHRQHPVNIFMLPILLRHEHTVFEICVYHTGTMHDDYTRKARAAVDRWREAAGLDDTALQQQIIADGIDILIDLAGHTASHRLGVFALRAAPVQASFLGYPHSTGLRAIDWLIGDAVVSPPEHADQFSECLALLPETVFCWAPVDAYPLPPARPADAPVVFGSFNNAMKLSPGTIALWARVLHATPGSLLLLKAPSLRDDAVRQRYADLFAAHGIARERLQFRGPSGLEKMMQEYGDIDIALDPTPYNGGTTTLQALWMGVPVVVLAGGNFVSRMGASFLRCLGRPEWIGADANAYVAAAVALAHDCAALRGQRSQMRARMAASALCDIESYVSHFEALLRRMWEVHCAGEPRRLIDLNDVALQAQPPVQAPCQLRWNMATQKANKPTACEI